MAQLIVPPAVLSGGEKPSAGILDRYNPLSVKDKNQESWENDPVWNLVDAAEAPKAGPAFAQDVMRKVRQSEAAPAQAWWKSLFAPVPLAAGALAAAAVITFLVAFPGTPESNGNGNGIAKGDGSPSAPSVVEMQIEEELDHQLLIAAVEDPSLFSDEELLAMLY
jgi:hypothetical protein